QWKTLGNREIPSEVLNTITANNTGVCESMCNDNPFCIGYTYDNANATCTTKKLKYVDNSIAGVAQFKEGNRYGMKKYYDRAFTDTSNTIYKEDTGLSVCEKICY